MTNLRFLHITFALLALCCCGCELVTAGVRLAADSNRILARTAETPNSKRFNALVGEGNYVGALQCIREEIANPALSDRDYLIIIRQTGVDALILNGKQRGFTAQMDGEARRWHGEAQLYCGTSAAKQALVYGTLARYFAASERNGLALEPNRKAIEADENGGSQFGAMMDHANAAALYDGMGELKLARLHAGLAEHAGGRAFSLWTFTTPGGGNGEDDWDTYERVLESYLDKLDPGPTATRELERVGEIKRKITRRFRPGSSYTTEVYLAGVMARLGTPAQALQQLEAARALAMAQETNISEAAATLACTSAFIYTAAGKLVAARLEMNRCQAVLRNKRVQFADPEAQEDLTLRTSAALYEAEGKLQEAYRDNWEVIQRCERKRKGYSLADRAAFFRGTCVAAYWGLVRLAQARHARDKAPADFNRLLAATELLRARQMGEVMNNREANQASIADVIQSRLKPDEALIVFTRTSSAGIVAAMTREQVAAARLPAEALGDQLRPLLAQLSRPGAGKPSLRADLVRTGATLFGPVAEVLRGKTRLLVLPDGLLGLLPIDMLGDPEGGILIDKRVVIQVPSLKYLVDMRSGTLPPPPDAGLFAMADPVFSAGSPLRGLSASEVRGVKELGNAPFFDPLPETRQEVQEIAALVGGTSQLLLGRDATKAALTAAPLSGHRYVHIATHGVLGNEVPGVLEPSLVLSPGPAESGFLSAAEAAGLKLDALVTVLSACNTGSGEYLTGEGVMGLSRSFLLAGSRSVVVSLWSVDSLATKDLMVDFYKRMQAGRPVPEALREAKLALAGTAATRQTEDRGMHRVGADSPPKRAVPEPPSEPDADGWLRPPYLWAAFQIIGAL